MLRRATDAEKYSMMVLLVVVRRRMVSSTDVERGLLRAMDVCLFKGDVLVFRSLVPIKAEF